MVNVNHARDCSISYRIRMALVRSNVVKDSESLIVFSVMMGILSMEMVVVKTARLKKALNAQEVVLKVLINV